MVVHRLAQKWAAAAGLLAGLWSSGTAFAQTTAVSPPAPRIEAIAAPQSSTLFPRISSWFSTSADTAPPAAAPAGDGPGVVPHDGLPHGDGPAHDEGGDHGNYWEGIPPIQRLPRAGYFTVSPTGEGYYSLLDQITGNLRQSPPKHPHPRIGLCFNSFFDQDWSYLDKPDNDEHDPFDFLKRIKLFCDNVMFTTGGEIRYRAVDEVNSRLTGKPDNYQLLRERIYGDLWITNRLRIYGEFIDASTFNQDLPPLPIDRNKTDIQNLFVDLRTLEICDSPIWVRVGRQELLYGSERLISPLDWANTRRTFQGAKAFWQNEDFSFDVFAVQPVFPNPNKLDAPDHNVFFSGAWATYRPEKGQTIDLYYLDLNQKGPMILGPAGTLAKCNLSTIGSRYAGDHCGWLWDFEGMIQFGRYDDMDHLAGAYTISGGYQFKDLPMNPQFWIGYDWASGTAPGSGSDSTFRQLFPFGHYYFGFIDVVGRQNINDIMQQVTVYPTNWIVAQVQNHIFNLDDPRDALYGAGGAPLRRDKTGKSGSYVGDEIDLVINFHLDNHQDILIGYSQLYAGGFIEHAPTVAPAPKGSTVASRAQDPSLFYVQYSFKW
jgi:hypothetical protein